VSRSKFGSRRLYACEEPCIEHRPINAGVKPAATIFIFIQGETWQKAGRALISIQVKIQEIMLKLKFFNLAVTFV
jgi:hypothetical protein